MLVNIGDALKAGEATTSVEPPYNVTIMGGSAGGTTILALLVAPKAKGLFAWVIAESAIVDGLYRTKMQNLNSLMFLELLGKRYFRQKIVHYESCSPAEEMYVTSAVK